MSWLKDMMGKEPEQPKNPIGTVVIGSLEPDPHNSARDMVRKALLRAQFKTIDLGRRVPPAKFAEKAKEENADIIAVSCLVTGAKENLSKLAEELENAGLKGKIPVMIGGNVDEEDAEKIGAWYGRNKGEAVSLAKKAIEK